MVDKQTIKHILYLPISYFFYFCLHGYSFLDVVNQANLLLTNLKEIIKDLQAKNVHCQTQLGKLTVKNTELTTENKQLIISNKNLTNEVNSLKNKLNENVFR